MASSENPSLLLPDEPILSEGEDLLGRSGFARTLAVALLNFNSPKAMTAALYGEWGSGKSSILNLVAKNLEASEGEDAEGPVVIRFNPWHFTSIDQLITGLFKTIGDGIGKEAKDKGQKLQRSLRVLGSLLQVGRYTPFSAVTETLKTAVTIAEGTVAAHSQQEPPTPEQQRDEINEALDEFGQRVFVLIDDIDRLDRESIVLMMRLIRLSASFRHTTYVLAFDQRVVAAALKSDDVDGLDYLEKIVQVSYHVPIPEKVQLHRALFKGLDRLVERAPERTWETSRWRNLFHQTIEHYISTPRDVTRYLNSSSMFMNSMGGEVNLVDALGIEAIRTFAPSTYEFLRVNQPLLLGNTIGALSGTEDKEAIRKQFERSLPSKAELAEPTIAAVRLMFPYVEGLYGQLVQHDYVSLRTRLRICQEQMFPRYFLFGLPTGEVAEQEVQDLLAACEQGMDIGPLLEGIGDRVGRLIERTIDHASSVAPNSVEPLLRAMYAAARMLPWTTETTLGNKHQRNLAELTNGLLNQVQEGERTTIWDRLIGQSPALGCLCETQELFERQIGKEIGLAFEDVSAMEPARSALLGRIADAASNRTLDDEPGLTEILFSWGRWNGFEEPSEYVTQLVQTDDGALRFLVAMGSGASSNGRRYVRVRDRSLGLFVNAEEFRARIKALQETGRTFSENEATVVDAFLTPDAEDAFFDAVEVDQDEPDKRSEGESAESDQDQR